MKNQRFPIGTQFTPLGRKHAKLTTVIDFHTTTNLKGEVVKTAYVCTHEFMGQTLTTYDVCETTIARGKLP